MRPCVDRACVVRFAALFALATPLLLQGDAAADGSSIKDILARPGLFTPLTEPPCSYCSNQNRKGLVRSDDPVIAWIRGAHNGGAIPLRHFLAGPRIINDTYGLFFYDSDGGYVATYKKDYGYTFHGWHRGVMVARGRDGTLWSALTGEGLEGPRKGERLERIPSVPMTWGHWLMLHPESTAYDLFDGHQYKVTPIPEGLSDDARSSMGEVDARLAPLVTVLGVEEKGETLAFPIDEHAERAAFQDTVGGTPVAALWYGPTRSGVVFKRRLGDQTLDFYADEISPETAPFKDHQTGTRWTLAGRGVDGPLKGKELEWANSIQCRWYAWAAERPKTGVHTPASEGKKE